MKRSTIVGLIAVGLLIWWIGAALLMHDLRSANKAAAQQQQQEVRP